MASRYPGRAFDLEALINGIRSPSDVEKFFLRKQPPPFSKFIIDSSSSSSSSDDQQIFRLIDRTSHADKKKRSLSFDGFKGLSASVLINTQHGLEGPSSLQVEIGLEDSQRRNPSLELPENIWHPIEPSQSLPGKRTLKENVKRQKQKALLMSQTNRAQTSVMIRQRKVAGRSSKRNGKSIKAGKASKGLRTEKSNQIGEAGRRQAELSEKFVGTNGIKEISEIDIQQKTAANCEQSKQPSVTGKENLTKVKLPSRRLTTVTSSRVGTPIHKKNAAKTRHFKLQLIESTTDPEELASANFDRAEVSIVPKNENSEAVQLKKFDIEEFDHPLASSTPRLMKKLVGNPMNKLWRQNHKSLRIPTAILESEQDSLSPELSATLLPPSVLTPKAVILLERCDNEVEKYQASAVDVEDDPELPVEESQQAPAVNVEDEPEPPVEDSQQAPAVEVEDDPEPPEEDSQQAPAVEVEDDPEPPVEKSKQAKKSVQSKISMPIRKPNILRTIVKRAGVSAESEINTKRPRKASIENEVHSVDDVHLTKKTTKKALHDGIDEGDPLSDSENESSEGSKDSKLGPIRYDPKKNGCKREGLKIRRYAHPYWINGPEKNDLVVDYNMPSVRLYLQEDRFKKQLKKSGITKNKFDHQIPSADFLSVDSKIVLLEDMKRTQPSLKRKQLKPKVKEAESEPPKKVIKSAKENKIKA